MGHTLIRKRIAAAFCAVVVVVGLGQASGSSAATEQRTLLVLGDSLTWGTAYKGFGNVLPQLKALGTFEKVIVDGVHARNISGPARTSRNGVKTYKQYIRKGMVPDAVIVALGSNDLQQSPKASFYLREIRELLTLIGPRPVVWVNVYRTDSPSYPKRSATFNEALLDATSDFPNLTILDWSTELIANPRWLAFDKLHLQPIGYRARATMYVQAASELWNILVPPPITTPETIMVETTTTVAG
jgi:lysophospholipase L1-like esterase